MNINLARKLVIFTFLLVSFASATISAIHLEDFMSLGNPTFLSVSIAVVFELANISSMLIFVVLKDINKTFVWVSFIILLLLQIVGNVYFSFNYVYERMAENPSFMENFMKMVKVIDPQMKLDNSIFYLAVTIGVFIPIIAILLLKSIANYLDNNKPGVHQPNTALDTTNPPQGDPETNDDQELIKEELVPVVEEEPIKSELPKISVDDFTPNPMVTKGGLSIRQ